MRAVIIGNGSFDVDFPIKASDFVICADGGFDHAKAHGIPADAVIGDMDSVKCDISGQNTKIYPTEKDFTDSELAVEIALEKNCSEIVMLAVTGTRLDHTIANICLLKRIYEKKAFGVIIDKYNTIYYMKNKIEINNQKGKTLSLIPLNGDMTGVSNSGFYYPLADETLHYGKTRGVSNVVMSDAAWITAKAGEGIVVITDGH